jgi:hypothetical protein
VLFEPIQACAAQHERGYEVAQMTGDLHHAMTHKALGVDVCINSGQNLCDLKNVLERELDLATRNSQSNLVSRLRCCQETVLSLLGEESTGLYFSDELIANNPPLMEAECLHELMPAIYLCKTQRLKNLARHLEIVQMQRELMPPYHRCYLNFFGGLAASALYRQKSDPTRLTKLDDSITNLEKAANLSEWNFLNKVISI